ncbi:MAG: polyprenyl synthetase family protein [Bacteroidales bacterium]
MQPLTFEKQLETINAVLASESILQEPNELYEPIVYALASGGKRIRPAFVMMACDLFEGNLNEAIYPALGVEIFHNFTLLHDDLMDQAPMRRGRDTVQIKWSPNTAILSGDAMFALAYTYLLRTKSDKIKDVVMAFNKVAIGVCEGQQYDMNFETAKEVSLDEYIQMIYFKTAILLAGALQIGAVIGNASSEDADHLYRFGEQIGLAFQLQDDMLDLYADQDTFGKKLGGDIRVNKKTFLYLKALALANTEEKKILLDYFSSTQFDPDKKIADIKAIYDKLQIKEQTLERINVYYEVAISELNAIAVPPERKQALLNLASLLLKRTY